MKNTLNKPMRVQRLRKKGFNLQKASRSGLPVKYVGRPTKWGNPFRVEDLGAKEAVKRYKECILNNAMCYYFFDEIEASIQFDRFKWMAENLEQLRGLDLACFCSLVNKKEEYTPCHADILLELLR